MIYGDGEEPVFDQELLDFRQQTFGRPIDVSANSRED